MQKAEESPSSMHVWLVTCIFFVLIASGIALLILSMFISTTGSSILLPAIGMSLVGIPWVFWFLTCLYRTTKGRMQPPTDPPPSSGVPSKPGTNNTNEESGDERPLAGARS